ncbi:MAG: hypothetical protein QXH31_02595 [Thermoplasmatales archaeon]
MSESVLGGMLMSLCWRTFITDAANLKQILNLLLVGRETEMSITRGNTVSITFFDEKMGDDIARLLSETLGNKVERIYYEFRWRENVFLSNKPKYGLSVSFPFILETVLSLNIGERIFIKTENYKTLNPWKKKALGFKSSRSIYLVKIFTPILLRRYTSSSGKQSITFGKGYPMILTEPEISTLINGGSDDRLLAL